jgi:hypothetical protein
MLAAFPNVSTLLMLKHERTPAVAMLKLVSVRIKALAALIVPGSIVTSNVGEKMPVQEAHRLSIAMSLTGIDIENQTKRKYGKAEAH